MRRAEGDGAGQDADGQPAAPAEPAGEHLHGNGIHGGDAGPAQRAQRQCGDQVHGEDGEGGVGDRRQQRPASDEAPGRDDVGRSREGDDERADHEAELHGHRQQRGLERC